MDVGPEGLGQNIRATREQRRMSRPALIAAMGKKPDGTPWMSVSYLKQIENEQKTLTNIQTIYRIAQALGVGPEMLQGLPDLLRHDSFENGGVPLLRRLLSPPDAFGVVPKLFDLPSVDLTAISRDTEAVWARCQGAEYGMVADRLPRLLAQAQHAAGQAVGLDSDTAHTLLSEVYNLASMLLTKLGHYDLAFQSSTRSVMAADAAEDPLARAAAAMHLCAVLFRQGRADDVYRLATSAAEQLERSGIPHDGGYLAMSGALMLRATIGAARMGVGRDAWHMHAEADQMARHVPPTDNCRHTLFNATNVAMHAVSAAVDLGEPELALQRQRSVDPALISSKERVNRHRIELGRALQMREDWPALIAVLWEASVDAPEEFGCQRFAKEAVRTAWRSVDDRAAVPKLIELAQILGVARAA